MVKLQLRFLVLFLTKFALNPIPVPLSINIIIQSLHSTYLHIFIPDTKNKYRKVCKKTHLFSGLQKHAHALTT